MTMNTKSFLTGTFVGGITLFILGFLFYVVIFSSFMESQMGTATGVQKETMEWWPLILGNLAGAALLTYIFLKWAGISTFLTGLKAGALLGFLIALSWDMIMYDTSNLMTLAGAFADVLIYSLMYGIAGGVIGLVLRA
jgi:hypothetical protein